MLFATNLKKQIFEVTENTLRSYGNHNWKDLNTLSDACVHHYIVPSQRIQCTGLYSAEGLLLVYLNINALSY